MSDKAYVIQKHHFDIEEVNFEQLKNCTDNVILEYLYTDVLYFKRALFELDKLKFNIGILLNDNTSIDSKELLKDLLNSIRGFNINIGVWLNINDTDKLCEIYSILKESLSDNFITGIKGNYNNILNNDYPVWKDNGDIEDSSYIMLDFIHQSIKTVNLNTDYKYIYKENNLKPIKSNESIINLLK